MAEILAMVVNELLNNWDEQLPHEQFTDNHLVSAVGGLAPKDVYVGRIPCIPLMIFERARVPGNESFACDNFAYCDGSGPQTTRL